MVDMGGNFYGYMGDMSRVFSIGKLPEKAYVAHQVCLDIQEAVVEKAKPGAVCEDLYNLAIDIVTKRLCRQLYGSHSKSQVYRSWHRTGNQ